MVNPSRSSKALELWMNGVLVGTWSVTRTNHLFAYAQTWLQHDQRRPISLSLPLAQGTTPFRGDVVESFFDNLLPENPNTRQRIAEQFGARADRAFDLLEQIGRDCAGAIQLVPVGSVPPDVHKVLADPLDEKAVERLLDSAVARMPYRLVDEEFRISLAGAQDKIALLVHEGRWCLPHGNTPTTHILKLPIGRVPAGIDLTTSVENEWLCARIIQAFGIPVAHSRIERFGRHQVLVVTRFDRQWQGTWWARLPQEDLCQALGVPAAKKYQNDGGPGMDAILDILRGSSRAEIDRRDFLKTQLIFWLLGAPDGHAKNFSILLRRGGFFELAPLYDILSAWPHTGAGHNLLDERKLKLAMGVRGGKNLHYRLVDIQRRHWNATAKRNALGTDFEDVVQEVIDSVPAVMENLQQILPPDFPNSVSDPIFTGMRRQAGRLEKMPKS
ncbi:MULTISPECIES: type II toxin-antitoxin system HipA family toxin [Acidithiobacillus]|uniref:type II toxin-antitoxin system HipA family toxin n=1 Tax=Acidithiobacillus TaxID=119977 RepID=UPI0009DA342A|nr:MULTISPECIES: type II toxin-antitoxin system HipA family toxin [Acidithiobacillus]MDD5280729.1 type II toxin-antitoxin system HipA family toxin [Acidithiobacillus sp.]